MECSEGHTVVYSINILRSCYNIQRYLSTSSSYKWFATFTCLNIRHYYNNTCEHSSIGKDYSWRSTYGSHGKTLHSWRITLNHQVMWTLLQPGQGWDKHMVGKDESDNFFTGFALELLSNKKSAINYYEKTC